MNNHGRDWDRGLVSYPDPDVEIIDPAFAPYVLHTAAIERLFTGTRWSEGPVWIGDAPVPGVERHPQQPHAALGRRDRRGERIPEAVQQYERQYARPERTLGLLRARRPAGDAHGA